jgi:hypothetical protein
MVINDLVLLDEAPDDLETYFLATVLHELAHVLERPTLYRERPDEEPARLMFEALLLAQIVAEPPSSEEARASPPHHGQRFIRAALHLRHRAEVAGVCVSPALICPNRDYGLLHANAYRAALGDEPIRPATAKTGTALPPATFFDNLVTCHEPPGPGAPRRLGKSCDQSSFRIVPRPRFLVNSELLLLPNRSR